MGLCRGARQRRGAWLDRLQRHGHYEGAFKAVIPTLREHVPLKRIGTESEVSAAIVFLLSPAAAFISGSTLRIDGAASLGSRAWPLHKAQAPSKPFNGFHRAYLPDVLKAEQ